MSKANFFNCLSVEEVSNPPAVRRFGFSVILPVSPSFATAKDGLGQLGWLRQPEWELSLAFLRHNKCSHVWPEVDAVQVT